MLKWNNMQRVIPHNDNETCNKCGANLLDLANFRYLEKQRKEPTFWEELSECVKCKTKFILHYDIFDEKGHIHKNIFSEDVNNLEYNWQDILDESQKKVIFNHLKTCKECQERLNNEILVDAWFRDLLSNLRK
jgi:hypothetical protein